MAFTAGWFAAGVAAVLLGSVSVSMVGNRVTGSRPAPLSAADVRHQLDVTEATSTTVATSTTTTTAPPPPPTTATPAAPASRPPSPTTTAPVPTTREVPAELRTYTLVGGTVTLRFTASRVTVEVATPNPGFALDIEPTHTNGVRVELEGEDHRSRVEGWWDDGPRDEVHEEGD